MSAAPALPPAGPASVPEFFSLFGLEPRFAIDGERLARAYGEVLSLVHPDRHVAAGAGERRAAMQMASHANEAYQVLRSDCARAAYLCRRNGRPVDGADAAPLPPQFLEQQMLWRERLDDAARGADAAAVAALSAEVAAERRACVARIARLIDDAGDFGAAAAQVRELMFLDKLAAECERLAVPASASGAARGA